LPTLSTGGAQAEQRSRTFTPALALGLSRVA